MLAVIVLPLTSFGVDMKTRDQWQQRDRVIVDLGLNAGDIVAALLASQSWSHSTDRNSTDPLQIRDLTPVKLHEIARHRPVEIFKRGRPRAKVFVLHLRTSVSSRTAPCGGATYRNPSGYNAPSD